MTDNTKSEIHEREVLHERGLIYLVSSGSGWVLDRAQLPDDAKSELAGLLASHVPEVELKQGLGDLQRAFADAVEAAVLERGMAVAAEASSKTKKPSAKSGVQLRSRIDELMTVLD